MELVLVMAIIAVFTAIAAPRYISSILNYRVQATAQRVMLDLEFARARAMATSSSRTITFNLVADNYGIAGEQSMDNPALAHEVNLSDEPYRSKIFSLDLVGDSQLIFDGFGQPDSSGVIIVQAGDRRKAVMIDGATGELTLEEVDAALVTKMTSKGLAAAIN